MDEYGLWEENWFMSKSGEISYSPDPLLLFPEEEPHGPSSAKILNLFLLGF